MDLIVGITGASGVILGVHLLKELREIPEVRTHVVLSDYAWINLELETDLKREDVMALADVCYDNRDLAADISSGSFPIDGVIVLPCSMKTLSGIANGYSDNLIVRTCDVAMKERRPLVICPRETPLGTIHLKHMYELSQAGAVILPPMPAFYNHPDSINDVVDHIVMKVMDQFGIRRTHERRWKKPDNCNQLQ